MRPLPFALAAVCLAGALTAIAQPWAMAQDSDTIDMTADAQAALDLAREQAAKARARVADFEGKARNADDAAEKARAEAAALAAKVQQAEAAIGLAEAELALVRGQSRMLTQELAVRREPIVRLTGALQTLVRRPVTLSLLRPGTLRETVYLGAVLDSAIPVVRERTAGLRGDLDRARALEGEANALVAARRETEAGLQNRRRELQAFARQQRAASQAASGAANREEMRALTLAEEARDLTGLVGRLEQAGGLRMRLAALPGPVLRPANPDVARRVSEQQTEAVEPQPSGPAPYILPVDGRISAGFGEASVGGGRASGLELSPRSSAQVVAPGGGRITFAGPFRGFSQIVIIEHDRGWTSLVTGMAGLSVRVGDRVVAGSPIGVAPARSPRIALELRGQGEPVNPLELLSR